ncbi:hypothetical protein D3C72_1195990 [compost metagenome]
MSSFATCGDAVGDLVRIILIIEVDQEQANLTLQRIAFIAGAQFPGSRFFRFDIAAVDRFTHLAVLHRAERAFGIGVQVPIFVQMIHDIQRRQRGVVADVEAIILDVIILIGRDMLIAHARRDGPIADIYAVINVKGVGVSAGLSIAIVRAAG